MIAAIVMLAVSLAQSAALSGQVSDATGAAVAGATVTVSSARGAVTVTTAPDGRWSVQLPAEEGAVRVQVSAEGFAPADDRVALSGTPIRTVLYPRAIVERVTVSAPADQPLAIGASATVLDRGRLASAPALTLDDQLRATPGFSLFRRTSSRVANPTTQGVTLRGLAASGASRTLVLADGVPLNDPFGGWVYWDRVPAAAIDRVEIARGGSSDVHGDDAMGGVIRIATRTSRGVDVRLDGGSEDTARASGYAAARTGAGTFGGAGEWFTSDGYVPVAPDVRGPIDTPAGSRHGTIMASGDTLWRGVTIDGRASYFDESRRNGTPAQVNSTIARQWSAAVRGTAAGGAWSARGSGYSGDYRQTFSAVNDARDAERLVNAQRVTASSHTLAVEWIRPSGRWTWLVSASGRVVDADLDEQRYAFSGGALPLDHTPAAQRDGGLAVQVHVDVSPRLRIESGVRGDRWTSRLDDPPHGEQTIGFVEPRLTASVRLDDASTLRVSWLNGFRTPTINELYRGFRVGDTMTLANPSLGPEESSGLEAAFTFSRPRLTARAIGFYTTVDGAIYNATLEVTPALITRRRQNGTSRAAGLEVEADARLSDVVAVTGMLSVIGSRFTSGELDGLRIPQVPRVQGSLGVTAALPSWTAALDWRYAGAQFDDDLNLFVLKPAGVLNVRGGWRATSRVELFVASENLLDETIEAGRTPLLTLGAARVWRAGLNARW